jgi:hypothetical protein
MATGTATINVNKAASVTTITSNSPNPSVEGQGVTLNFSVSNSSVPGVGTATGTVTVTASTGEMCTGTLSSGTGSCTMIFETSRARTIQASYPGDVNFKASNSATKVMQTFSPSNAS